MSSNTTPSRTTFLALCAISAGLASAGCTQQGLCDELGTCGGADPVGTWQLAPNYPSCSEDLYVPATDPRLLGAELAPARTAPIEPALYDWCYLLVTTSGDKIVKKYPRIYYESQQVGWASVTYKGPDPVTGIRTYTAGITRTGTFYLDFPAVCMRSFGAEDNMPVRDQAGMIIGPPNNVCKQLEAPLAASAIGEGSYPNLICEPNVPVDPGGCLCQFDVSETGGPSGTYEIIGNTIRYEPSGTPVFPQTADFCNKGDKLELTGHGGNYLFNQKGLRTMSLKKIAATCNDGMQSGDETGIDCGGTCPNPCAI